VPEAPAAPDTGGAPAVPIWPLGAVFGSRRRPKKASQRAIMNAMKTKDLGERQQFEKLASGYGQTN
jgi:hypothetical protein